jgi:hypothetical protein
MKKRGFNIDLPFYSFFFKNLEQRIGSTPIQTYDIEDFFFFFSNFQLHLIATFSNSSTKCDLLGKNEKLKESPII